MTELAIPISITTKFAVYAVFLLSLNNIVLARTGLWPVGHLAFFGIGAFTLGFLTVTLHWSGILVYLAALIAVLIAALVSLIPAAATFRLRGDFFILVSLAMCELVRVAVQVVAGPGGFSGVPRPPGVTGDTTLMVVALCVLVLAALYSVALRKHRVETLCAIARAHEPTALTAGIDVQSLRTWLFAAGALLAATAGVLFAWYSTGTDPQRFTLTEAVILFTLAMLGGIDSIAGSLAAAAVFTVVTFFLDTILRGTAGVYAPRVADVIFGLILVITVRLMRSSPARHSRAT